MNTYFINQVDRKFLILSAKISVELVHDILFLSYCRNKTSKESLKYGAIY